MEKQKTTERERGSDLVVHIDKETLENNPLLTQGLVQAGLI